MNSRLLQQSTLKWLDLAESLIGDKFICKEKVNGGTSTDIWHVICSSGHQYAVRKRNKKNNEIGFINNVELAISDGVLPKGFKVFDCGLFYLSYYFWIDGNTYNKYKIEYTDILKWLFCLHTHKGYGRGISSYVNIVRESEDVLMQLDDDLKLLQYQKNLIRAAAIKIKCLSDAKLEKMLNNRRYLTHGDLKPKNIVLNCVGYEVIDWDKLCSVSPEFDIVYSAYTGMFEEKQLILEKWDEENQRNLETGIIDLSLEYLPHMYLIHDTYYYLLTGDRYEYLIDEVFPLYYTWMNKRR